MNFDKEADIKNEKSLETKTNLLSIKSEYFLQKIFDKIDEIRTFKCIRYNKKLQKILKISIKDYEDLFSKILIEIKIGPYIHDDFDFFINIKKDERKYYHIYLNDEEEELNGFNFNISYRRINKVKKAKIIIDKEITSLAYLFNGCDSIESITFKQFYRENITDMSYMFSECRSLKELNITNFKTKNVTSMRSMFFRCEILKELNVSNFNTEKVTDMNQMFGSCSSLTELDLSNFNTEKVKDMRGMFNRCTSLVKLNISNFSYNNVTGKNMMFGMFAHLPNNLVANFKEDNRFKDESFQDCVIF